VMGEWDPSMLNVESIGKTQPWWNGKFTVPKRL
jgi:hypothetical protein